MQRPNLEIDRPAPRWQGRDDGPGEEHLRWHRLVNDTADETPRPGDLVVLGFSSDTGVQRNQGRVGAAKGPQALRRMLGSLATSTRRRILDVGDVVVRDDELEAGQERLSNTVRELVRAGGRPIVLGGGHESVYGSFQGLHRGLRLKGQGEVGVLNLDAHFDLRTATQRSSGTPFNDLALYLQQNSESFHYAVLGINRPSNATALFDRAEQLRVRYLLDEHCVSWNITQLREFVRDFLARLDAVQLSIDLDVLPAAVAPGVSAPAGFGVSFEVIQEVCRLVAGSGKLALLEVVELNPGLDIDDRTARSAARLIDTVVQHWVERTKC